MYEITIENKTFKIIYLNKKMKTRRLKIALDGNIYISGYRMNEEDIIKMVNDNANWIIKTFEKLEKQKDNYSYNDILSFNCIWIFGNKYLLKESCENKIIDNIIYFNKTFDRKKVFLKIRDSYLDDITRRFNYYCNIFNLYPLLTYKDLKSKFGYCKYLKNHIVLSKRLVHFPIEQIDYVIVHEFCHFYVIKHNKDFYQQVEKILPDYKQRIKKLRESSYLCEY